MRNALRRLGVDGQGADDLLEAAGVDPSARAETLPLQDFARIAEAIPPLAPGI
jgi:16S rRNA A1518/A1519 N6-dimethyltransferase RsmA/KsgA/DIM1 with predicted DNA glycosylase/AP lyase activity